MKYLQIQRRFEGIFDKVQLNLGIKKNLTSSLKTASVFWDNFLILPLSSWVGQRIFKVAIDHYGAAYRWDDQKSQNIDVKHQNYGYGQIHHSIIRSQRLKKILCVGSMYGFIPYMMAKACMENGAGVVDFIDAGFDMNEGGDSKNHNYGLGFWKKVNTDNHFNRLLDNKYINVHVMTSKEFVNKYPNKKYDYICLDADHRYKEAKRDFKRFWGRLKEEGFLVFHDIHLDTVMGGIKFGYCKLWQELIMKYEFKFELPNGYSSLGFLQKMTKPRKISTRKDVSWRSQKK